MESLDARSTQRLLNACTQAKENPMIKVDIKNWSKIATTRDASTIPVVANIITVSDKNKNADFYILDF